MFLLPFLIGTALADSYSADFQIIGPKPGGPDENTVTHIQIFDDVAIGYSDTTVTSSWSYITCSVKNGDVVVVFESSLDSWPQSWPTSATCSGGGHTLTLNLKAAAHNLATPTKEVNLPQGVTMIVPSPITYLERKFLLPTSYSYVAGDMPATLSGAAWDGVGCVVDHTTISSTPHLFIGVWGTATPGNGLCTLDLTGGGTLDVPVHYVK